MDYYKVLDVPREATNEEITAAYRTLARKYHPDVCQDQDAVSKFKEAAVAFETLSDPAKRHIYNTKNRIRPKPKAKTDKTEKPKNSDGTVDYSQDPNFGKFHKPTPPVFDIWGKRLSQEEREQWVRDAESDMFGLASSQDMLDEFRGKPVRRRQPPPLPPKPPKPEFIDMMEKEYLKGDIPNIRR